MIYGPRNVHLPAHVYDVDRLEMLSNVCSINTTTGEVECHHSPVRLTAKGDEFEMFTIRFTTIYPIKGGYRAPTLFHCYGRLS